MDMQMNPSFPDWLVPVSWIFLGLAVASALAIAVDIAGRRTSGRRGRASVAVELVWITSALYLGPFALALHARHRNRPSDAAPSSALVGLPGGGASAVAHVVGVPLVVVSGLTIAGIDLWVMILVIGALAVAVLFAYERAVAHERNGAGGVTVGTALGAAALTVLAFDVGMGGWMLLLHFNEFMPAASEATFWFLMQLGIVLGLVTGYPAAAWLARRNPAAAPV